MIRDFILDNAESIRNEVYAAWWWCRCRTAWAVAQITLGALAYCKWRGERAWISLAFAKCSHAVARRILPAPLRIME